MTKSIMIDTETLGTRADAVILSIGAVKFDLERGKLEDKGFYTAISIDSSTAKGRHISESTIGWWIEQGDAAKRLFKEETVTLETALIDLSDWMADGDYEVWSCGADFDIAMLTHAFGTHDLEVPWKFFNSRCFRTYKKLPGAPACKTPPVIAHHALHDAVSQAQHLVEIYAALFANKPTVLSRKKEKAPA